MVANKGVSCSEEIVAQVDSESCTRQVYKRKMLDRLPRQKLGLAKTTGAEIEGPIRWPTEETRSRDKLLSPHSIADLTLSW